MTEMRVRTKVEGREFADVGGRVIRRNTVSDLGHVGVHRGPN